MKKIIPFILGIALAKAWIWLLKDVEINYFLKWLIGIVLIITVAVLVNKIKQKKSILKEEN